jgi:hypothetical protein
MLVIYIFLINLLFSISLILGLDKAFYGLSCVKLRVMLYLSMF